MPTHRKPPKIHSHPKVPNTVGTQRIPVSLPTVQSSESVSRRKKWGWGIVLTLVAIFVFWLLKPVFALLAGSIGIAYICNPIVSSIEKRGFSRSHAIYITTFLLCMSLCLLILIIIPPVIIRFDSISANAHQTFDTMQQNIDLWVAMINTKFGLEISLDISTWKETLPTMLEQVSVNWKEQGMDVLLKLFTSGLNILSATLNILLLPVFTYYILEDWQELSDKLFSLLPLSMRPVTQKTLTEVHLRLNAFVLGQIKVCLALAVLYSIGLWIVGIELAFPIGILSGLLFIIPYVGTIFGIVSAGMLGILQYGISFHLIGVFLVFAISQLMEGYYLTPKIIGESVGLSPLVVMISLIVGASFLGLWGMLLAIPITAVLSVIGNEWLDQYKKSHLYTDTN